MNLRAPLLHGMALLGLLAACASSAPRLYPIPDNQHGTFRFSDRVTAASPMIIVEGEFTIRADTILAAVTSGNCQPVLPPSTSTFEFRCGTVRLIFNRHRPLHQAGYTVQGTRMATRQVCVRYTTNAQGQQICAQYRQERDMVNATFSGNIRGIPVP